MVRFAFSSPELYSAAVRNGYSRIFNLHEPVACLQTDAGVSFSTMRGMSPLLNLKHRRKLSVGLKREMGAALADSLTFAHQNLKPLTNHQKSVCPHQLQNGPWPAWPLMR